MVVCTGEWKIYFLYYLVNVELHANNGDGKLIINPLSRTRLAHVSSITVLFRLYLYMILIHIKLTIYHINTIDINRQVNK